MSSTNRKTTHSTHRCALCNLISRHVVFFICFCRNRRICSACVERSEVETTTTGILTTLAKCICRDDSLQIPLSQEELERRAFHNGKQGTIRIKTDHKKYGCAGKLSLALFLFSTNSLLTKLIYINIEFDIEASAIPQSGLLLTNTSKQSLTVVFFCWFFLVCFGCSD